MPDWTNLDVTPVGQAPGSGPPGPSTAAPPGGDPFGSRPSRRRRGWIRVVLGVVVLVGGCVAAIGGIVRAVDERDRIESGAVARGVVTAVAPEEERVTFEVPDRDRRDYTVYLLFEGVVSKEPEQELAVRDTGCTATLPSGDQTTFRGSRQNVSSSVGQASSVGHFSAAPGTVAIRCAYVSSSRRSRRQRPDSVAYVVTPGKPAALTGTLAIVGGVFAALAGGFLSAWGWRGRRQPL